jgi:hypothetical protein
MSLLYTFIILFLIVLALFLGQIAIQFIKLERKVETAVDTLEEELVDVFGLQPVKKEPAPPKKEPEANPKKRS